MFLKLHLKTLALNTGSTVVCVLQKREQTKIGAKNEFDQYTFQLRRKAHEF